MIIDFMLNNIVLSILVLLILIFGFIALFAPIILSLGFVIVWIYPPFRKKLKKLQEEEKKNKIKDRLRLEIEAKKELEEEMSINEQLK
jgi:uncharacterized SAM-binding protein YcdF (DUF218 family)